MKKNTYMAILGVTLLVLSCQEKITFKELTWKENTSVTITPDSLRNFVVALDKEGMPVGMLVDELTVQFKLDWQGDNPVQQVTLFIQLEENIDGIKKAYGIDNEIELGVITDFNEDGSVDYVLKSDEVYALFSAEFNGSRDQEVPALSGDNFEITWKITGADGTTSDVRNECLGAGCQYGFAVDEGSAIFNWWDGTFDYEWKEASADVIYYGYGDIEIGATGSIDITSNENPSESTVSHTLFNYYWGEGEAVGTLTFDVESGAVSLIGEMEEIWIISNINGPSLDIDWTYQYGDEYGKVTLTRKDGKDWPTNIYTSLGEAPEANVWSGTFNYEWLEASADVITYGYGDIEIGTTGSIDVTPNGNPGESTVSHTLFNYYWGAGEAEGTLTYTSASGLSILAGDMDEAWVISNVDGPSLEIDWTYQYSGEYGKIKLTRSDGYEWPTNIASE